MIRIKVKLKYFVRSDSCNFVKALTSNGMLNTWADCLRKFLHLMISSVVDSLLKPLAIKISSVVDWRRIWLRFPLKICNFNSNVTNNMSDKLIKVSISTFKLYSQNVYSLFRFLTPNHIRILIKILLQCLWIWKY